MLHQNHHRDHGAEGGVYGSNEDENKAASSSSPNNENGNNNANANNSNSNSITTQNGSNTSTYNDTMKKTTSNIGSNSNSTPGNNRWKKLKVGSEIAVYWEEYQHYYPCKLIEEHDDGGGAKKQPGWFRVKYESGELEWHDMKVLHFRWQDDPIEEEEEDDDEAAPVLLPEGWSQHFDPKSGLYYYYHAKDGTTTWERPKMTDEESAATGGGTSLQSAKTPASVVTETTVPNRVVPTTTTNSTTTTTQGAAITGRLDHDHDHGVAFSNDDDGGDTLFEEHPTNKKNGTDDDSIRKQDAQNCNDTAMLEEPTEADTTTTTSTAAKSDTLKPKSSNNDDVTIGARIGIWWKDDSTYYPCTVLNKRTSKNTKEESKQEWFIEYDDGEFEWLDLATEQVCWIHDDDDTSTIAADENTNNTITIDDADDNDAINKQEWARIRSEVHIELKTMTKKKTKRNGGNTDGNGGSTAKSFETLEPKGYYKIKSSGNFLTQISASGKTRYIGTFSNEEDASLAYAIAKSKIELSPLSKPSKPTRLSATDDKQWQLIRTEIKNIIKTATPDMMKKLLRANPKLKANKNIRPNHGGFEARLYAFGKTRYIGTFPNKQKATLACRIAMNNIKLLSTPSKPTTIIADEKAWQSIRMDVIHYIDKTPVKFLKNLHFAVTTTKGYSKRSAGTFQANKSFKGKNRTIGTFKHEWTARLAHNLARYRIDKGTLPAIPSEESSLARSNNSSVTDTNQRRTTSVAIAPTKGDEMRQGSSWTRRERVIPFEGITKHGNDYNDNDDSEEEYAVPQKGRSWTQTEHNALIRGIARYGYNLTKLATFVPCRTERGVESYIERHSLHQLRTEGEDWDSNNDDSEVDTNFVVNNKVRHENKQKKQKAGTNVLADNCSKNMTQKPRETMIEFGAANDKCNVRTMKKTMPRKSSKKKGSEENTSAVFNYEADVYSKGQTQQEASDMDGTRKRSLKAVDHYVGNEENYVNTHDYLPPKAKKRKVTFLSSSTGQSYNKPRLSRFSVTKKNHTKSESKSSHNRIASNYSNTTVGTDNKDPNTANRSTIRCVARARSAPPTTPNESNYYWYHPIDPNEEIILCAIGIEIALLAEESIYCNRLTTTKYIDWPFVFKYASPALKHELLKCQPQPEQNEHSGNSKPNNKDGKNCTDNDTTLNNLLQCGNDKDSGMSLTVKLLRFDIIRKELRRKLLTNSKTSTIRPKMASIIKRKRKQSHPLRLACLNKKKKKETTK